MTADIGAALLAEAERIAVALEHFAATPARDSAATAQAFAAALARMPAARRGATLSRFIERHMSDATREGVSASVVLAGAAALRHDVLEAMSRST